MLCVFSGDMAASPTTDPKATIMKAALKEQPQGGALKAMVKWKRALPSVRQDEEKELHHELAALQATLVSDSDRCLKFVEVNFGNGVNGLA
jgi:hypothetical protein